ncbi:MAG: DsbE family thiol:disulfide interchange protein [Gammaproteobacteria bacterium]|nr:DsbE family thiol:disulfide interchange protein [Gammaproteobacteria bacterium]
MNRFSLPLGIFVTMVALLAVGLTLNPREIPSPFIGKPAPEFLLPALDENASQISNETFKGKVWVLNVWASWCVACRQEHPLLMDVANRKLVTIVGLNYKDKRSDALEWLQRHGDPYRHIPFDEAGNVAIDYGVYGVPETFVIDKAGIVRLKHIGPVTLEDLKNTILPLVSELERIES